MRTKQVNKMLFLGHFSVRYNILIEVILKSLMFILSYRFVLLSTFFVLLSTYKKSVSNVRPKNLVVEIFREIASRLNICQYFNVSTQLLSD